MLLTTLMMITLVAKQDEYFLVGSLITVIPPNALQAHTMRVKELSNPAALRGIKRFYGCHLQDLSHILCLFVFSSLCEVE